MHAHVPWYNSTKNLIPEHSNTIVINIQGEFVMLGSKLQRVKFFPEIQCWMKRNGMKTETVKLFKLVLCKVDIHYWWTVLCELCILTWCIIRVSTGNKSPQNSQGSCVLSASECPKIELYKLSMSLCLPRSRSSSDAGRLSILLFVILFTSNVVEKSVCISTSVIVIFC